MKWFFDRLAEPSTYAGIGAIAAPVAAAAQGSIPWAAAMPSAIAALAVFMQEGRRRG